MYNVILRCVLETTVAVERQYEFHILVLCFCVCPCSFSYPARKTHAQNYIVICDLSTSLLPPYFSTLRIAMNIYIYNVLWMLKHVVDVHII